MMPQETIEKEKAMSIAFIDDDGVKRHGMTLFDLNELYRQLEMFQADMTREEYEMNKETFVNMMTIVHQRMRFQCNKKKGL